jgi:hypothetical protein
MERDPISKIELVAEISQDASGSEIIQTAQQSVSLAWQPKFIWKATELDGLLPFQNYT